MKKLMAYVGRLNFTELFQKNQGDRTVFIATPHKLIVIENLLCRREGDSLHLEFSIRNRGSEINCFGLKLINNFDRHGYQYDYTLTFGKGSCSDGKMLHYTLPEDIPIRVKLILNGVGEDIKQVAQVKFSGICIRNRRHNKRYNPSGILLLRNIPVTG